MDWFDPKTTLCLFSYSTFSGGKGLTMGWTCMLLTCLKALSHVKNWAKVYL
jgi:hypothetical protein